MLIGKLMPREDDRVPTFILVVLMWFTVKILVILIMFVQTLFDSMEPALKFVVFPSREGYLDVF